MRGVILCLLVATLAVGCGKTATESDARPQGVSNVTALEKRDLKVGTGAEATAGRRVTVHYDGWLYDVDNPDKKGNKFDSSRERGEPFDFRLGAGEVIPGWDQGVVGMKVGGQRRLTIPPALAYGSHGAGEDIPANATLVFDVELLDVK